MFGMTREAWAAGRPALLPENESVFLAWRFCQGWDPAAVPMAAVLYEIADMEFLYEQLLAIRDRISAHDAAQREASKAKGR